MYELDSEPYTDMVKKARERAARGLKRYGEPAISLAELRRRVDNELRGLSLTELILKERK